MSDVFDMIRHAGGPDSALDVIYGKVDGLMRAGKLEELSGLFSRATKEEEDIDLMIGWLSSSLPVRSKIIPVYSILLEKTYKALKANGESPEKGLLGIIPNPCSKIYNFQNRDTNPFLCPECGSLVSSHAGLL